VKGFVDPAFGIRQEDSRVKVLPSRYAVSVPVRLVELVAAGTVTEKGNSLKAGASLGAVSTSGVRAACAGAAETRPRASAVVTIATARRTARTRVNLMSPRYVLHSSSV